MKSCSLLHFPADWKHRMLELEDPLLTTSVISLFTDETKTQTAGVKMKRRQIRIQNQPLDCTVGNVSPTQRCLSDSRSKGPKKRFRTEEEIWKTKTKCASMQDLLPYYLTENNTFISPN